MTRGFTGTILVGSKEGTIIVAPYAKPSMDDYSVVEEADVAYVLFSAL